MKKPEGQAAIPGICGLTFSGERDTIEALFGEPDRSG